MHANSFTGPRLFNENFLLPNPVKKFSLKILFYPTFYALELLFTQPFSLRPNPSYK